MCQGALQYVGCSGNRYTIHTLFTISDSLALKKQLLILKNTVTDPAISVVIPSYNSSKYIRKCLSSLRVQKCKMNFEIILVDSSNDGTDKIVSKEFPEVKMIKCKERTFVGSARNIGVEEARGEIILFLDTDCIAPSDWVDRMYRAIKKSNADGVGGALENGTPLSITGTVGYYLEFFRFFPDRRSNYNNKLEKALFLVGANCGFKKILFNKIKYYDGFDETKVGEDFYFCWQLLRQANLILFAPGIFVRHQNKSGLARVMRYQYKFGIGACYYRYHVSKEVMKIFLRIPLLSFLMPFAVIPWIGYFVIKRLGIFELMKYTIMLPLVFIGNFFWAYGFFRQINIIKRNLNNL